MSQTTPRRRLSDAFRNASAIGTTASLGGLFLVSAALFWYAASKLGDQGLQHEAEVVAAALRAGGSGDMTGTADRLFESLPRLWAVGRIGEAGRLELLYPNAAHLHTAATAYLSSRRPVSSTGVDGNPGEHLYGVGVPINPDFPEGGRYLMLLSSPTPIGAMAGVMAIIAIAVTIAGAIIVSLQYSWFKNTVCRPLLNVKLGGTGQGSIEDRVAAIDDGGWVELERVALALQGLRKELLRSNAKKRNAQRKAEEKIRDHETGLNHKLQRAEDKALTDALTGVRNRAFLEQEIEPFVEHHRSSDMDVAIVMIDLDNFKAHNDRFGHAAGDELLSFIGKLLNGSIRPGDHAIRYGGDEFMLLLSNAGADQARRVADRVRTLFVQYVVTLETDSPVTLSAGVSSLRGSSASTGQELLTAADEVLYRAKRTGKNTVEA